MKKQETINFLNCLAKQFEQGELDAKAFRSHCESALVLAEWLDAMDYIDASHLKYQAEDISNKEYTRFEDPDLLIPLEKYNCDDPNPEDVKDPKEYDLWRQRHS